MVSDDDTQTHPDAHRPDKLGEPLQIGQRLAHAIGVEPAGNVQAASETAENFFIEQG